MPAADDERINPGSGRDKVELRVNGKTIKIYSGYTIRKSILTQPAQFNLRFGWGDIVTDRGNGQQRRAYTKDLIDLVRPRSKFQLYVNNSLQQTGYLDGFRAHGTATEIEAFGRDNLALIHDAYLLQDVAFANQTYKALTEAVLAKIGINERVDASDEANLKLTMGVGIQHYDNPATIDQIEEISTDPGESGQPTNKIIKRSITAKLAETYYQFLQRQYRRAGIFLWAAGDGSFVLSEPNSDQPCSYKIVRHRGQVRNAVNAIRSSYSDDITHRFTSAHVYGRAPGRKGGRAKAIGEFIHDELNELFRDSGAGNDAKPISFRDVNVQTQHQAEFFARRRLSEFNRAGWHLSYVVSGHTVPNLQTGLPTTWCPNTMVQVEDDEYGLKGNYYLEEVSFSAPPCETTLTLMRPDHMLFASDDDESF